MTPDALHSLLSVIQSSGVYLETGFAPTYAVATSDNLKQRNELLKLARSDEFVDPDDTDNPKVVMATEVFSSQQFVVFQEFLCKSILHRSLISTLCINSPLSKASIDAAFTESFVKEIDACTAPKRKNEFCFDAFFGAYDMPILKDLPVNRKCAKLVHVAIDRWLESISTARLVPKLSKKTMSSFHEPFDQSYMSSDVAETPIATEIHYQWTGTVPEGLSEMKQAWTPSNIKPRTYFAPGTTAADNTKYAMIFDKLVEQIPSCAKFTRTKPSSLQLADFEHAFIYDLTSFTSNLHPHLDFLNALARYCDTVDATTMIYDGFLDQFETVSVSSIVRCLATEHDLPGFVIKGDPSKTVFRHNIGGPLGVRGNIVTAMFLHTSVAIQTVFGPEKLNVAGDDGIVADAHLEDSVYVIEELGKIQLSKCYSTRLKGCVCLKRPLTQIHCQLFQSPKIDLPSFEFLYRDLDPRYTFSAITKQERRSKSAAGVFSCLQTAFAQQVHITGFEWKFLLSCCKLVYDSVGLPYEGCVPSFLDQGSFASVLDFSSSRPYDPVVATHHSRFAGFCKIPVRYELIPSDDAIEDLRRLGTPLVSNSTSFLGYLVKTGQLRSKKRWIVFNGPDAYDRALANFLDKRTPNVETFERNS